VLGDRAGVGVGLKDGLDDVALDEFSFSACAAADGVVGDAVDVAKRAGGGFVEDCDGVGGEELFGDAGSGEASADVLGGVVGRERLDAEAVCQSREKRAISAHGKALVELGESDQDERKQGFAVPGVVEQDVQVVEGVLVHEVGLVDEEDGEGALASEILDVFANGMEDVAGGSAVRNVEGVADVPIEVSATKSDVVAVGQSNRLIGAEGVSEGAQNAGFPNARLTADDCVLALLHAGDELRDETEEPESLEAIFYFGWGQLVGHGLSSLLRES